MAHPSSRRRLAIVACSLALATGTVACSSDDGGGASGSDVSAAGSDGAATERADLSTYPSVAEMASALTAAGMPCTLEYEGLTDGGKELSLCTLEGEQATLSIWFEPEQLDAFMTADLGGVGAAAVGANWTVDVTTAALATRVADALGGTVKA